MPNAIHDPGLTDLPESSQLVAQQHDISEQMQSEHEASPAKPGLLLSIADEASAGAGAPLPGIFQSGKSAGYSVFAGVTLVLVTGKTR